MKLAYVELCGFRGYRTSLRIDFADSFTIIDGRNGVGKSTIFDAVEFALTGGISKYGETRADGETVRNYFWWNGPGRTTSEPFVEVGFSRGEEVFSIRRTQLSDPKPESIKAILDAMCDVNAAPESPLRQLCATAIVRDEHIAALSLDLSESERYSVLREAIGAIDADAWIQRGSTLVNNFKRDVTAAERAVSAASADVSAANRRVDEIRSGLVEEEAVAAAAKRLATFTGSNVGPDKLLDPTRIAIAERLRQLQALDSLMDDWDRMSEVQQELVSLRAAATAAEEAARKASVTLSEVSATTDLEVRSDELARQARELVTLVELGRRLGLHADSCPLCSHGQTQTEYQNGMAAAETYAHRLNAQAAEQAKHEQAVVSAREAADSARKTQQEAGDALKRAELTVDEFHRRLAASAFPSDAGIETVRQRQEGVRLELADAQKDLQIVETLRLNSELERAKRTETEAKAALARTEEKLGVARRAETRAQALHNAARRASGETMNQRLDRVLPLIAELYKRLRPHPVWDDIDYKMRGDLRRYLTLQVGGGFNPQFMFSSGQRRATGLAFLLAVNLSLSWSRWRTILLDDPVQHVDDFRSVHLAEVLAQLVSGGRQIVCAVEDAALADLLCRRLPVDSSGKGKRVTLGPDSDGALAVLREAALAPMPQQALVTVVQRRAGT